MKNLIRTILFLALCFSYMNAQKLTLGFMPYLSSDILLKKYTPLAKYLSKELGMEVGIVIAKNYDKHIKDTADNKLDISFLGGSPYVFIADNYGKKPIAARYEFNHKPVFRSVIFTSKDSSIKTLKGLKGKKVAFGSKRSTLSTQVPLYMLNQQGIYLKDLSGYVNLRNHENVIYGVLYGDFDAGAVAQEVFKEKKIEGLKLLSSSKELSTHLFVTRNNMDKKLFNKIKKAFLSLEDKAVLESISKNLTGFVEGKDEDYDYHRKILDKVLPQLGE